MSIKYGKILWLFVPVLALAVQACIEIFVPTDLKPGLHSEYGPHEMLQSLIMLVAAILALRMLTMPQVRERPFLFAWVLIAFVCSVYVTGEELSWGQHMFEWNTPEYWTKLNDQGETNLHNTSIWLDQKPRLLLEIGVLVGGIIIPSLRYFKVSLPQKFSLIYPDSRVFVTSILALIVKVTEKVDEQMKSVEIFHRASEIEEIYLFYFVFIYLVFLRQKMASYL